MNLRARRIARIELSASRAATDPATAEEARIAADLVRRIRGGDRPAEDKMIERYSRGVLLLLSRLSGSAEVAEDLHQETFRVVLERLRGSGLEDPGRLVGFIQGTARHLFLGERRKYLRRRTDSAGEPLPDDLEGRVPTTWLDLEILGPVERRPVAEFPELRRPSARPDSPEQVRELEEKLRSLGYVE